MQTVVMESTGVYWIPPVRGAGRAGLPGDAGGPAAASRTCPGARPTCWTASGCSSYTPTDCYREPSGLTGTSGACAAHLRQRAMLVEYASHHIQHVHKALTQMNVKLQHVIRDITGKTGMDIIKAIVGGERNPRTTGAAARPQDQGGRGDHCQVAAGPLAGGAHLRADPGPGAVPVRIRPGLPSATGEIEAQLERFEDRSDGEPPAPKSGQKAQSEGNAPRFDVQGRNCTG